MTKKERHAIYMREVWYPKNKVKHRQFVRAAEKKRVAIVYAFVAKLKDEPCVDCQGRFPAVCMDFDHLPGAIKSGNVSQMVRDRSVETIMSEIAKCELVCSNCHRIRTASRLGKR